jgi:hypothetical protein
MFVTNTKKKYIIYLYHRLIFLVMICYHMRGADSIMKCLCHCYYDGCSIHEDFGGNKYYIGTDIA